MNKSKTTIPLLTLIVAILAYGVTSFGQEPRVQYRWGPPTTGSEVVVYTGELQIVTAPGDTNTVPYPDIPVGDNPGFSFMTISYQYGRSMRFRVAGIDDMGRQGPWSIYAPWWVDNGPPGQPGAPLQTLQIGG